MHAGLPTAAKPDLKALLPSSPDAYPQAVDLVRGLVLVVRMNAAAYRAASFLDDRILGPATEGAWMAGSAVTQAARQATGSKPVHFIFHTGHVGSTLLSRLLDETGSVLGLREPLPLRTLADAHDALGSRESLLAEPQFDALLDMMLRLWSRGYPPTRAVIVKATSSAGRLAHRVLAASAASRAVYMNLRAEPHLATLLGGANSTIDLRGHGAGRMRRLLNGRDLPVAPLHALSAGELAALGWLVEGLALAEARAIGARLLAIDFDELLADVAVHLRQVMLHFNLPPDDAFLRAVPDHPVLRQYSKAPELPFPPGERAARLAQSRREHRDEISKGLAWLDSLAHTDERIAAVVSGGT